MEGSTDEGKHLAKHAKECSFTFLNMSFCSTLWIFPGLISPLSVYSKNLPLTLTSRVVKGRSSWEQLNGLSWPLVEGVPYLRITPTMSPGREVKTHEADLLLLHFYVSDIIQGIMHELCKHMGIINMLKWNVTISFRQRKRGPEHIKTTNESEESGTWLKWQTKSSISVFVFLSLIHTLEV